MSNSLNESSVQEILSGLKDPETGRNLGSTQQIENIAITGHDLTCTLKLSTHSRPIADEFQAQVEEQLRNRLPDAGQITIQFSELDRPPVAIGQIGLQAKSVIAVGSGKGGVGKSTVAVSLALSLAKTGAKVGLMDADVYGPSVPHLLGINGRPEVMNGKIQPIFYEKIPVMSIGFLVEPDQAVIWRGPMLHGSITQFLKDTYWGQLDYLIIDMPPGTGDIALTLSQMVPLAGAVVVCTPQQVALLDAIKAIAMFRKVKIPILGMVENMSGFTCPDCNKHYDIFGRGGAREKAEELDVPFLGDIPINISLRQQSDEGRIGSALDDATCDAALNKITRALVREVNRKAAAKPHGPALPVL